MVTKVTFHSRFRVGRELHSLRSTTTSPNTQTPECVGSQAYGGYLSAHLRNAGPGIAGGWSGALSSLSLAKAPLLQE